jgi:thiol-disulfide isomerase/thioredoxin
MCRMSDAPEADTTLLVAGVCAAWCGTCRDYRPTFEALAREFGASTRFVWIDVEDDEAVLGPVEVEDFPTLLLALGDEVRFFGPILPHAEVARALVERALQARTGVVEDASLKGFAGRLLAIR